MTEYADSNKESVRKINKSFLHSAELVSIFFLEVWSKGLKSDHLRSTDVMAKWSQERLQNPLPESSARFQLDFERPAIRRVSVEQHRELEQVVEAEVAKVLPTAGASRQPDWEAGWAQNLRKYLKSNNDEDLVPGYFEKSKWIRLADEFYEVQDPATEALALSFLVDFVLANISSTLDFSRINEFGCGTGFHAQRLAAMNDGLRVTGYDWAGSSQEILHAVAVAKNLENLRGRRFDFFHPDQSVDLSDEDLVLTIAALEQTGDEFGPFLDFLLAKSPGVVVNIEPIAELLDTSSNLGRLSVDYFRKRKYLSGYFDKLVTLESEGAIEILHAGRSGIGSLFIEGYSVVIWKPIR